MTKRLEIEAIRQRAEKATEGPWYYIDFGDGRAISSEATEEEVCMPITDYDADFIAHAREDIPALLAEVEQLRIENEKYEIALSQIAQGSACTPYPHDIAAWALWLIRDGGDSE